MDFKFCEYLFLNDVMELVRIPKISAKNDRLNKNIIESVTHNEALTLMRGWTLSENDWN